MGVGVNEEAGVFVYYPLIRLDHCCAVFSHLFLIPVLLTAVKDQSTRLSFKHRHSCCDHNYLASMLCLSHRAGQLICG